MKSQIISLFLLCSGTIVSGQSGTDPKTLLDNTIEISGWFVELPLMISEINDETYFMPALGGGIIVNNSLRVGLMGVNHNFHFNDAYFGEADQGLGARLKGSYGGLFLEPIIGNSKAIHLTIPILIGAGYSQLESNRLGFDEEGEWEEIELDEESYFVLQTGLALEVNLHKNVRFGLGGGYRYTSDLHMQGVDADALHGFTGNFSIKVGKF